MVAVPEVTRVRFRGMTPVDVDAVMEVELSAYRFPWTAIVFRDCIRVGYHCRVLEMDNRLEAYGVMSLGAGEAHILNLCVRPVSQGRGLARCMLHHLLDRADVSHVRSVFLEVRPSNIPALRLYRGMGFCEVGLRKGYYPATVGREDALVMAKELM